MCQIIVFPLITDDIIFKTNVYGRINILEVCNVVQPNYIIVRTQLKYFCELKKLSITEKKINLNHFTKLIFQAL